jgi:sulfite exporter TauE/SafE
MKQNVGTIDRVIRFIAGAAIIAAGVYYQSWWGAIGAIPLLTAIIGWCPPYALFGWNTCKKEAQA